MENRILLFRPGLVLGWVTTIGRLGTVNQGPFVGVNLNLLVTEPKLTGG